MSTWYQTRNLAAALALSAALSAQAAEVLTPTDPGPPPSWYPSPAAPARYRPTTPAAPVARVAEPADDWWRPPERALGDGRTLVLDADPLPDWPPL